MNTFKTPLDKSRSRDPHRMFLRLLSGALGLQHAPISSGSLQIGARSPAPTSRTISTSLPRQYYSRPQPRDLPPYRVSAPPSFLPSLFLYRKKLLTFWPVLHVRMYTACLEWPFHGLHRLSTAFLACPPTKSAFPAPRCCVLSELRESEDVRAVLGDPVRPEHT